MVMMMNNMKVKKGLFRIYIVLSIVWFCFFSWAWISGVEKFITEAVITSLIPVPLYFVLKWISDGFK